MKTNYSVHVCILVCLLFLFSCATIDHPQVNEIKKDKEYSKTLQTEEPLYNKKKGLKRKVAIARFSNETKYGQSFFLDSKNDRIGKQALDILSSKLLETDKFILLERADLDMINEELTIGNYAALKNMADYLIIGSVTEFGRKDEGKVGVFSRTKKQTAFAKVHIRLIDVRTGRIIYSEEGEGESFSEVGSVFGIGGRAGYDSTINDKALEAAITDLSSNIIENLLDSPWRSFILGHDDGKFIIAGGSSQNINKGDLFKVIKEGKEVMNPQTNMIMHLPGVEIGKIRAIFSSGDTPEAEITECEVIEGDFSTYFSAEKLKLLYIQEN